MKACLITIGDELLEGVIRNSNAEWFGEKLWDSGLSLERHISVSDDAQTISEIVQVITESMDICVLSGGLGPTSDDQTTAAIANALNSQLIVDTNALTGLLAAGLSESRAARQAQRPECAQSLKNHAGHAPIIKFQLNGCLCFALPGVPKEFKAGFQHHISPLVKPTEPYHSVTLSCLNIGESTLSARVASADLPPQVDCRYQAAPPFTHLRLRSRSKQMIDDSTALLTPLLGVHHIKYEADELNRMLSAALKALNWSISTAESCTSGLISAELGRLSGASSFLQGGICAYSNTVKTQVLGVKQSTIEEFGAVSEACAREMALNVRSVLNTEVGLSVTGIAGPDGGTPTKPVGTVCFGWSFEDQTITETVQFRGNRASIRKASAVWSLNRCLELLRAHNQ